MRKKVAYKAWLANKSSLELCSQYSEARKAAATKVRLSKKRAWKEFGERLDDDFKTANKVLWQTIVCPICILEMSYLYIGQNVL